MFGLTYCCGAVVVVVLLLLLLFFDVVVIVVVFVNECSPSEDLYCCIIFIAFT